LLFRRRPTIDKGDDEGTEGRRDNCVSPCGRKRLVVEAAAAALCRLITKFCTEP
uniref:Uncharacterized protein n=1 Tax=Meloidogyne javanica TaxID=6303 RepID=A0A915N240_MELJA